MARKVSDKSLDNLRQGPEARRREGVGKYLVMLPHALVGQLDKLGGVRSHHIEQAVKEYLERLRKR